MKRLVLMALLVAPVLVFAKPVFVDVGQYDEVVVLEDLSQSQLHLGELAGFPHTYVIKVDESITTDLSLIIPKQRSDRAMPSLLVVQQQSGGVVTEVTRQMQLDNDWERWRESSTFDVYHRGETLSVDFRPGEYIIEVSSADNFGTYALQVGEVGTFVHGSYTDRLAEVWQVKHWAGKGPVSLLKAPTYWPITIVLFLICIWVYRRYA